MSSLAMFYMGLSVIFWCADIELHIFWQVPGKMGLLVGVMLLCFARSVHAAGKKMSLAANFSFFTAKFQMCDGHYR